MRPQNTAILVQEDKHGIFVRYGTRKFRPGSVKGHEALPMDDGGAKLRHVVRISPRHETAGFLQVVTPKGQRIWSTLFLDEEA